MVKDVWQQPYHKRDKQEGDEREYHYVWRHTEFRRFTLKLARFSWVNYFSNQDGTFQQIDDPDHQLSELQELETNPLQTEEPEPEIVQNLPTGIERSLDKHREALEEFKKKYGIRASTLRPNEQVCKLHLTTISPEYLALLSLAV